ncbi:MAG: J domain-containing protein [Bacteriovorax sp.]|nr:J domain-containing protein [Rhizobacter sp.]
MSQLQGLQISADMSGTALTPEQKRFNTLIKQTDQARQKLAAWHDSISLFGLAHAKRIAPLIDSLTAAGRDMVVLLDRLLDHLDWTKAERATLRELVCDGAAHLIEASADDDPEMKALFDKHSEVDFDTGKQQSLAALKEGIAAMTGLDLGDDTDIASDEDLFRRLQERMAAEASAHEEAQAQSPPRPRRKTAAQQRKESEAQLATQSVREIYRKLASALHPDRETDPVERVVKTELMQKANQAYAANDLLALLELQLQIEQVDAGHIATASAQRVRHYNQVLAEQLAELKTEIERVQAMFQMDFGLQLHWNINPLKLGMLIDQNAKELRAMLAEHQREMRTFADKAATKRWLKQQRQRLREAEFDNDFF